MEGSSTVNYAMRFILPAICIVVFVLGMGIADVTAQDKSPAPGASTASSPESKPSESLF
jgi:hypothetical protein